MVNYYNIFKSFKELHKNDVDVPMEEFQRNIMLFYGLSNKTAS